MNRVVVLKSLHLVAFKAKFTCSQQAPDSCQPFGGSRKQIVNKATDKKNGCSREHIGSYLLCSAALCLPALARCIHLLLIALQGTHTAAHPSPPPPPFFFNNAVVSRATLQKAHRHVNPENSAELLDSTINARLETSCMH